MNRFPASLLLAGLLLAPLVHAAEEPPLDCAALKAENEALKARIRVLEGGLSGTVAPVSAAPAAAATPGLAPKPATTVKVVEEEPYSRSGCRASLFSALPHAIWMERDRWDDLKKGMNAVAVEKLLGPEHYDTVGGGRTKWEYGKCGSAARAQLLFEKSQLVDWRPPSD